MMGTQAQKAAAAHTRAARWPSANLNYELSDNGQESLMALTHYPACSVDSDSDDDCGYTGGVNVCVDSEWQEEEMDGRDDLDEWSDTESHAELEGDELEANLQALRSGLQDISPQEFEVTTPYEEIKGGKSAKTFANAEKKCGLGYNSLEKHTKQLHDKKARDGAAMHEQA